MSKKIPLPLAELRNVRLTLGGRLALRGVTWAVRRGEGWLVTGPNGAGKTSLLRILTGRRWPDAGKHGDERVYCFGGETSASPIGLEGRIAWLSPETHQRFARLGTPMAAGEVILTGFANTLLLTHRPSGRQRASARTIAGKLGIASLRLRPFAGLSQGQQRLVLLARALAPSPQLLVLDEFSDGLDQAARARVGKILAKNLRAGAAVVVASHRAGDGLPGLTRQLAMRAGKAMEVPILKCLVRVGTPLRGVHGRLGEPSLPRADISTLQFVRASVYVGDHARTKRILHDLNWTVRQREHWVVAGPNGSGKSTLLRAIYGELPVARGGLLQRFGKDERALPLPEARRRMGYVSPALQHYYAADVSVEEVAASGFQSTIGLLCAPTQTELAKARASLRNLGAGHLAKRRWGALSFGEARLALLARALVIKPKLLLLDEPGDGLAPKARTRFMQMVESAAKAGTQIILAAHRAEDLPACINRVLRLHNGRVI